jgi:hypothetical protein
MNAEKLGRAERFSWEISKLKFEIERHGRASLGSVSADVQEWTVDLDIRDAKWCRLKTRQINPSAKPVDVRPLVQSVVDAVKAGRFSNQPCEAVTWVDESEIEIAVGKLIPSQGWNRQTLVGRRKRFRNQTIHELGQMEWYLAKPRGWKFRKEQDGLK